MATPQFGDIVETSFDYSDAARAESAYGFSNVQVFDGNNDLGPGVYHPGDVVQLAAPSGFVSSTDAIGLAWSAAVVAQSINSSDPTLAQRLVGLGRNPDEMYLAYIS
jgi:hypothetical protein